MVGDTDGGLGMAVREHRAFDRPMHAGHFSRRATVHADVLRPVINPRFAAFPAIHQYVAVQWKRLFGADARSASCCPNLLWRLSARIIFVRPPMF